MIQVGFGIGAFVAIGLFFVGVRFLVQSRAAARGFGIPDSELGEGDRFWLVKGDRDLACALLLGVLVLNGSAHVLAWGLLLGAVAPVGDCAIVLTSNGSRLIALGVHGATALLMLVGAAALFIGH